jgi:hypothetical protein
VLGGQRGEACQGLLAQERAGGVVGVDDDDGAGAGQRGLDAGEVHLPVAGVAKLVAPHAQRLEAGQVLEEGIAGLGDQHRVARIAEQLEEVRVRFAGAGGQDHARRITNGLARGQRAERCWLILGHRRIVKGRGQGGACDRAGPPRWGC